MLEILRVATAVPNVAVANPQKNVDYIIDKIVEAQKQGVRVIAFPELAISGYTSEDLFFQKLLQEECLKGLKRIVVLSESVDMVIAVGMPMVISGLLFNVGVVVYNGRVLGVVPKTYMPTYNEFYERRWFSSANDLPVSEITPESIGLVGGNIPVGNDLIFDFGSFRMGAEICEDFWVAITPGSFLALNGAELMVNFSASDNYIGKRDFRRMLVEQNSSKGFSAYLYVSAGCSESTSGLVFSGHSMVAECGKIVAENKKSIDGDYILVCDVDLGVIRSNRAKIKTFSDGEHYFGRNVRIRRIYCPIEEIDNNLDYYHIEKSPYIPNDKQMEHCGEIFEMQVMSLVKRLQITSLKPVIGVSGGLDSTLALLVAVEAVKRLGKPLTDVVGITMPCFGTSGRTHNNAVQLMRKLGITYLDISIKSAVEGHLKDINHLDKIDATYENAQARERTQVLMDYAGSIGGLVVGTGDLSESALGWCTYNGDHMSMYSVNIGLPKTLVRWTLQNLPKAGYYQEVEDILLDIVDTPISPELLPLNEDGGILQETEDIVGPYSLHDFFIYYTVNYGFTPEKVFALACKAFADEFDRKTVKKWLVKFYYRFFNSQFKRNCSPDGVKITKTCLSPKGDWRMVSDACKELWIKRAEALE